MSNHSFDLSVDGQGLYDITSQVAAAVAQSGVGDGLATVFIQHTSASLLIQENADSAVQVDLQNWLSRLVPELDSLYTHTEEGPDDMPAHIKGALTAVQVAVPVIEGRLALGVWQGIYLWEHRHSARTRSIVVNVLGEAPAN
jgi:secondary thiamine-phosphate synthase enzyme